MYNLVNRYHEVISKINKLFSQIENVKRLGDDAEQLKFLEGLLSSLVDEKKFWENTLENTVFIAWSEEDILSVNPLLSKKDVSVILDRLIKYHDAEYGVSWDTIRTTIQLHLDEEYNGRGVEHSEYGEGVLQEFGNDYISITFDDGKNVGFTREEFDKSVIFI